MLIDSLKELSRIGAIYGTMITCQCHRHYATDAKLAIDSRWSLYGPAQCQNSTLRRIYDRQKGVYRIHAEVADRE